MNQPNPRFQRLSIPPRFGYGMSLWLVLGCAAPRESGDLPEVNAGLSALAANRSVELSIDADLDALARPNPTRSRTLVDQAAMDLESVMDRARARPPIVNDDPTPPTPVLTADQDTSAKTGHSRPEPVFADAAASKTPVRAHDSLTITAQEAWSQAASKAEPHAARNPEDELVTLAENMASLLREPGTMHRPKLPDEAALAPIEALRPGALESLDQADSALSRRLRPADRRTLLDARDRLAAGTSASTESQPLSKWTGTTPVRIGRSALCTKVAGFGQYTPYPTSTFTAGKPVVAIVYTEVENFASRPARESDTAPGGASTADQVSVELSQSLTLFQDPGGLQAWHKPPQRIIETARNRRRDFYLVQRIELPRTLSIGRYNLKITVRDHTTGAEAESIIPITITAN